MPTTKELLGARIRELRKGCQLSQEQLAEKVGVDSRYVSRIELGKCFPSLETLEVMSHALNAELRELFEFSHLVSTDAALANIDKIVSDIDDPEQRRLILRITQAVARAVRQNA